MGTVYWKIYYADGTTFSNLDGEWPDAPARGVICVVVRDPTKAWGRWVSSGYAPKKGKCEACGRSRYNEYYVCLPGSREPRATHELEAFFYQTSRNGVNIEDIDRCIKYGEQASQKVWEAIMHVAVNDPDFPRGSPRRRHSDWN